MTSLSVNFITPNFPLSLSSLQISQTSQSSIQNNSTCRKPQIEDDTQRSMQITINQTRYFFNPHEDFIGKGAFSHVYKVSPVTSDSKSPLFPLALKISSIFERSLTWDINLCVYLQQCPGFEDTGLLKFWGGFRDDEKIMAAFEIMSHTSTTLIKKLDPSGMPLHTLRTSAKQLLTQLSFIHKNGIIHTDIKPDNILHDQNGMRTALSDFGNALTLEMAGDTIMTQTPSFRAPEVALHMRFSTPIDMWSLGCLFYHYATGGEYLFRVDLSKDTLKDNAQLLAQIIARIGPPSPQFLSQTTRVSTFFECNDRKEPLYPLQLRDKEALLSKIQPLEESLARHNIVDENFIDFLRKMLTWEPQKRISAIDALSHPFMNES